MGLTLALEWHVLIEAFPGMPRGGDTGLVIERDGTTLAILIDASGHGLAAYSVAHKARETLLESSSSKPTELIDELHAALRGTIGASVSIVRIREDQATFAGIGNVRASINLDPFIPQAGVLGIRMRTAHASSASLEPGQWLLMHTDGVSQPRTIPNGNPESVATKLMEAHGKNTDDSGILVLRRTGS